MTLTDIYERVNLRIRLEQRRFLDLFNDTVAELFAMYPDYCYPKGCQCCNKPVTKLSDEYKVRELFVPAIVDNIISLSGADENGTFRQGFLQKAHNAWLNYWREEAHNRHIKRGGWGSGVQIRYNSESADCSCADGDGCCTCNTE